MLRPTCLAIVALLFEVVATAADNAAVIRSAQDGAWSSPKTWRGESVPGEGARVQIVAGHTVTYDVASDAVVRGIHVAGRLTFARDRGTTLNVGLIKIEAGDMYSEDGFDCEHAADDDHKTSGAALEVGTRDAPIPAEHTVLIRLHAVEGQNPDSCPAIVSCGGRMEFHGARLSRTWLKLGAPANRGDAALELSEAVEGWRAGDRVIVTGTDDPKELQRALRTEERIIESIDGRRLTFHLPLEYDHACDRDFRGEVANLSRNVIVESADPARSRGHTMYHSHSTGSISYAEFRHLGKEGVLGRYSLHFHLVGNTMRGSSVVGASIWDSGNRWLTIHGTNYLVVRDCVGYKSLGHGFFLEDGTEVLNALDRNLAVQARAGERLPRQVLPFDANAGAGFWWANSLNSFTKNVACECGVYGFRYEASPFGRNSLEMPIMQRDGSYANVDIRTLPFVRFEGNETHSNQLYGIDLGEGVERVGPDARHPFVLKNTKIWAVHQAFAPVAPSVLVDGMHLHRVAYGVYRPLFDRHVYRNVVISEATAEPFNRALDDNSRQWGIMTADGLTFIGYRRPNMPFIQMSDNNMTGAAESHFRNIRVLDPKDEGKAPLVNRGGDSRWDPETEKGVPLYLHDYFGAGQHAKLAATTDKDFGADGLTYREEPTLTGEFSRVAQVTNVRFPELLHPVDDLPPATMITSVERLASGNLLICGTVIDASDIKRVLVNDAEAVLDRGSGAWQIELAATTSLHAYSEDTAGNLEELPHVVRTTD